MGYDPSDDEFDYDEFVEREFAQGRQSRSHRPIWRWTAAAILLAMLASFLIGVLS